MAKEWVVSEEDIGCDGSYLSHDRVVRCRDCKYWLGSDEMCLLRTARLLAYEKHEALKEDGFCSSGERKDGLQT